jgi:hypothetical protein
MAGGEWHVVNEKTPAKHLRHKIYSGDSQLEVISYVHRFSAVYYFLRYHIIF